jgi:hypothetical protein
MLNIIYFIVFILIIGFAYRVFKNSGRQLQNHWSQYLNGLQYSVRDLYKQLTEDIKQYQVENLTITEVTLSEGGVFSANRLYLRITQNDLQIDICFAPFGNSASFVSWWLWRTPTGVELILSYIPIFGPLLNRLFFPQTYFTIDSANAFMTFNHLNLLVRLDELLKQQQVTAIPEADRHPIKLSILKRDK